MKNSTKKLLMVLVLVLTAQMGFATTYTTVQDGPWTSGSTWAGGNVPPNGYVPSGDIININHEVEILGIFNLQQHTITISNGAKLYGSSAKLDMSNGVQITNNGKVDVDKINLSGSNVKLTNNGRIYALTEIVNQNGGEIINNAAQAGYNPYIETGDLNIADPSKLANSHHIKVNNKFTSTSGANNVVNNSSGIIQVSGEASFNNPGIVNEGSLYLDGPVSNDNITGSGSTCSSDGQSAPSSSQDCDGKKIDDNFPIELVSFTAKPNQNQVELTWTTATEENNEFFTIERSQDGQNWEEIATIPGAGNSNELLQYSFVDQNPLEGQTYYHLKQTDFDGTSTYSEVRVVKLEDDMENSIKIYPNPTLGQIQMDVAHVDINEIHVLNIIGQDVTTAVSISKNGEASFTIDLNRLPKGMYFIQTPNAATKVYKQ